jgi:hypothetical protein
MYFRHRSGIESYSVARERRGDVDHASRHHSRRAPQPP